MKKNAIVCCSLIMLLASCLNLNAQKKGVYNLKFSDSLRRVFQNEEGESVSQIIIYPDNVFEFYFASVGFVHKYSFGKVEKARKNTIVLKTDLNDFRNRKNLSIVTNERCKVFRFIELKSVTIILGKNYLKLISPINVNLSSRDQGVPVDSLINCDD